jgi:hypothetical protein
MADITTLREAVAELVHDGDSVALEGFTHLIPFAAGHELIRQGRRHPRHPRLGGIPGQPRHRTVTPCPRTPPRPTR